MKIGRLLMMFLLTCIVSCYFFPFEFSFLPVGLNTKQILGVVGIAAFLVKCVRERAFRMSKMVVASAVIALIFSLWCYFCIVENGTDDTSYAEYWVSFAVWLGGAFGVCSLIRAYHGRLDLRLLTNYLVAVCTMQCILCLLIDNYPGVQLLVDTYVRQGQEFLHDVKRLYGIGCALDPAGIRFAAVLILMAHQISTEDKITDNKWTLALYLGLYLFITVIGNMVSRTTTAGAVMGLVYILLFMGFTNHGVLSARQVRFYGVLLIMLAVGIAACVYLYNTNPKFQANLRFAFEAFFNYFETGTFRTSSTDKLNSVMWVWPKDTRSWIIGTGLFGNFVYNTDIGYCRFTLYCGLVGLALFSSFFIYNGAILERKFRNFTFMALMLISLTFIIWVKVATDIFLINALLFCIDGDYDDEGELMEEEMEE